MEERMNKSCWQANGVIERNDLKRKGMRKREIKELLLDKTKINKNRLNTTTTKHERAPYEIKQIKIKTAVHLIIMSTKKTEYMNSIH